MGKTAAIYNPYLDTLGGGERYTLSFAQVLLEEGYSVDIEWRDKEIMPKLISRFGLKHNLGIKIVDSVNRGENYDLIFYVSDGSIPTLRSSHNYLHFQVPFKDVGGKSLLNRMKLYRINKIICNSNFTKKVVDKEFGVDSLVLYPPIDTHSFKVMRKENIILYVGRFSNLLQSKGQDFLVESFKKMHDLGVTDWRMVLAGGVEIGSDKMLMKLKSFVDGYPIEIVESPTFDNLKTLYGKSKIFWSASGIGVDELADPKKVEHFGMTVVESMSAGNVPVVLNVGGHREIVEDGVDGILWNTQEELISKTINLINKKGEVKKMSSQAILKSDKYSIDKFKEEILQILN